MIEAPALKIVRSITPPGVQPGVALFLKKLDRDDSFSRDIFPEFVDRAVKFISLYDAPTDPGALQQFLFSVFHSRTDDALLLAAIDKTNHIAAHMIARVDHIGSDPYAFVLQVEKLFSAPELTLQGNRALSEWAERKGLKGIAGMMINEKIMRLRRIEGFKLRGYLMTRDFKTMGGG